MRKLFKVISIIVVMFAVFVSASMIDYVEEVNNAKTESTK